MIRLRVSRGAAERQLARVPHAIFQRAIHNNWDVDSSGRVTAQSVCWLYCWAKTGLNSAKAAEVAMEAFNDILNVSYARFDARVPHDWARAARYMTGDIEDELAARLTGHR